MNTPELSGSRFGRLLVKQKLSSTRGGSVLWECMCDCGSTIQVSTRHLNRKNNNVRSCGCLKLISGSDHKDWDGFEEISGQWWCSHVKHSANSSDRKTINLEVTKEEAWILFLEQNRKCKISGVDLIIHNKASKNTASIDRIDNTLGYTLNNIQWVHKAVNMMKRIYSNEYFIEWCKIIAAHQIDK